jgi:hypothetical protein
MVGVGPKKYVFKQWQDGDTNPVKTIIVGISYPMFGGWGGIRLSESVRYAVDNPASIVFVGEKASNAEMVARLLKERGYNAMRVMFGSPILETKPEWGWNDSWFQKVVAIAKTLDLWLIVDYHAYYDSYQFTEQWISFWRDNIISKYKDAYEKLIWEPINEPVQEWNDGSNKLTGRDAVNALANQYQQWIDMARSLGDTHWIVVSAVCWWNPLPMVEWFPQVNDPLNKTFLTMHFYYFYEYNKDKWSIEKAVAHADKLLKETILPAIELYKKPFICTEMGAHYGTEIPPDVQYTGAAGYSTVTLAFVQRLINNFDNIIPRVGYILWPAGDWSKAGLYGAMNVWGNLLTYKPFA